MISKIIKGYGALFAGTGRILLLLLACTLIGAAFVIPLWAFAIHAPAAYTILVLAIAFAVILLAVVKKARSRGIRPVIRFFLQLAVLAGGLAAIILFVLHGYRFVALLSCLLAIIVYGAISFGFSEPQGNDKASKSA